MFKASVCRFAAAWDSERHRIVFSDPENPCFDPVLWTEIEIVSRKTHPHAVYHRQVPIGWKCATRLGKRLWRSV